MPPELLYNVCIISLGNSSIEKPFCKDRMIRPSDHFQKVLGNYSTYFGGLVENMGPLFRFSSGWPSLQVQKASRPET